MEGAPELIDGPALQKEIENLDNDVAVKDFHLWSLSRGKNYMTARVQCHGEPMKMLKKTTEICKEYGIDNITIQIEDIDEIGEDFIKQQG